MMWNRLIIEGNAVYEIDEECLNRKQGKTSTCRGSGKDTMNPKEQVRESEKK